MQEIKELIHEVKLLRETTHEIYVAIQGNDKLGQRGMKHTIEDHGTRLERLEQFRYAQDTKDEVERATESGKIWKARLFGMSGGAAATATAMAPKSFWGKIFAAIQSIWT